MILMMPIKPRINTKFYYYPVVVCSKGFTHFDWFISSLFEAVVTGSKSKRNKT